MITMIVVVLDESVDLLSEIDWQIVVLQQHAVVQGLVQALDLALGLRGRQSQSSCALAMAWFCPMVVRFLFRVSPLALVIYMRCPACRSLKVRPPPITMAGVSL